ncbi:DUF4279 domain-containing protein [Dechloromonas denitrificans]|uniref:DUF4279 domain-containing protein n=1 Tax=Dechloromonas denitrificans TaxID=281362 RepID=UPI001CF94337|nr:DUF4279 domain-containing protein [Dechloromonas denitrificans]UCV09304.1 DUF4279 domain-containing protein [Dechloromonas denitrificans]
MSDPNEIYAYFTITGNDLDPAEITKALGVTPTDSWKKGDVNSRNGCERKFGRWSLYSRLARSEEFEAHIADVLAQLEQNADGFRRVSEAYEGCMQLVGYFHSYYPGLFFTPQTVQGLAKYKLGVDHDFYYLHSDAREDADV